MGREFAPKQRSEVPIHKTVIVEKRLEMSHPVAAARLDTLASDRLPAGSHCVIGEAAESAVEVVPESPMSNVGRRWTSIAS